MNIRAPHVSASLRPRQGLLLVLLLALAGCGSNPIQSFKVSLPELPFTSPRPSSSLPPIAPPQMGPGGKALISEGFIDQFFQKRVISGEELLFELVAIRQAAGKLKSGAGLMDLLGAQDLAARPAASDSNAVMAELQLAAMRAALSSLEGQLDKLAKSGGSAQELDQYLGALLDAKQALAEEKIELPSGSGLNAQQKRRMVTMAAMLVAMRLSNKQLDQARKDFAGIEDDYLKLIERREQAAGLLYELLQQGQGTAAAKASQSAGFSRADQDFLAQRRSSLSLKEFSNDMGVQNLALRLLRQRDPALYADYRSGVDRSSKRTQAYVRSMVGGAAFGSLVSGFGRQLLRIYKDKKNEEMLAAAPLVLAYGSEVKRGLGLSWDVTAQGIFPDLGKAVRPARFRLSQGEQSVELASAAEVMAELDKGEAGGLLREALFRDHALGLIYRVYLCDRAEAGRMLDRTMPAERRDLAARMYLKQPELQGFSFAASFSGRPDSTRELELGDKLLRRDHRRLTDESSDALSQIQRSVTERSRELSNDQLLRLIFANREGSAMRASLDLGRLSLRAVPSMQAVYAYEAQVDGCRSLVTPVAGDDASSTPPPAPAPKPRDKVEQGRQDNKAGSKTALGAKPASSAPATASRAGN